MRKNLVKYKFEKNIRSDISSLMPLDNWHCWIALAEDFLLIIFSVYISVYISWLFLPLSIIIIGSRQRALATILHEAAHGVFAKNKKLNYVMGTFFSGYLIAQTMSSYKKSHVNSHHAHFGDVDRDPDYKYAIDNGLYQKNSISEKFNQHLVMPLFLIKVPSYLKSLIQERLSDKENNNKNEITALSLYWITIISVTVYTNTFHYLLIFWFLPYITTFNIIGWYIELGEHYPLMKNNNTLYMTRNRHGHFIENFLTGMHNENYHLIHHLFPTIPFWNLPKAHEILMRDNNYKTHDQQTGGIFLSKDKRPSLIQELNIIRRKEREGLI